jgi:general secretion pathway protein K
MRKNSSTKGGALLAVLWLSAALAAIAFSLASTVRGETERTSTLAESVRAYYIATAGADKAILKLAFDTPDGAKTAPPRFTFDFRGGRAVVEIVPETAKLSLNQATYEEFYSLLLALGASPPKAQEIGAALLDWRSGGSDSDNYYLSMRPSFRARHASFQEIEEALLVKGMTPELFHGSYGRDPQGRLIRLGAFKDCVSVYATKGKFDANYAEPALLVSLGMPPQNVPQLLQFRSQRLLKANELGGAGDLFGAATGKLTVGGQTIFTVRATGRIRRQDGSFSDASRTVAAQVKFTQHTDPTYEQAPYQVLRWDDYASSEVSQWQ